VEAAESSESESDEDSVDVVEQRKSTPARTPLPPTASSTTADSRRSSTTSDKLARGNKNDNLTIV